MSLSSPSHLHDFLREIGARPQKRLSQNFLIDRNILNKIVLASECERGDSVLEIGSGPGALTEALLERGVHLTAVEKDPLFAKHLTRFQGIQVFEEDILSFDLAKIRETKKAKVIANLPYSLTSPILGLLLPRFDLFSDLTVMVQHEVALRLCAKPGGSDYSAFTLFANFYAGVSYAFKVSRRSFYPAPKVDSAIVRLILKPKPIEEEEKFFTLIKKAFQKRRKMLRSSLKECGDIESALATLRLNPESRPENLSLPEWIALSTFFHPQQ